MCGAAAAGAAAAAVWGSRRTFLTQSITGALPLGALVRVSSETRVQSFSTLMTGQKKSDFDLWK